MEDNANPDIIYAPFSDEQVERLNWYQRNTDFHPFTCAGKILSRSQHPDGEGILVATNEGWTCYCGYTQNWAHRHMLEK